MIHPLSLDATFYHAARYGNGPKCFLKDVVAWGEKASSIFRGVTQSKGRMNLHEACHSAQAPTPVIASPRPLKDLHPQGIKAIVLRPENCQLLQIRIHCIPYEIQCSKRPNAQRKNL